MRIRIECSGIRIVVLVLFFVFISFESIFAQPDPGTGINQVDSRGRKQGAWVKTMPRASKSMRVLLRMINLLVNSTISILTEN